MMARPRATSLRIRSGASFSRLATYSISSVMTPCRAKCICEKFFPLPFEDAAAAAVRFSIHSSRNAIKPPDRARRHKKPRRDSAIIAPALQRGNTTVGRELMHGVSGMPGHSEHDATLEFRNCARVANLMDAPAISTENLTRRFGELGAVQDVNLQVAPGQFFGFLGPNGAGKSTTIKMLTGLLAPSSGRMQILGHDLVANPVEVKRNIGVVPEGMALFGRLTGAEFLNFAGRMYGLDRQTAAQRATELLEFLQLADQPKA